MKILLYTDVHWSTYSSIIRQRGELYSIRLENLIESVNWAESLAIEKGCDQIMCLGDFFDKATLTAEEVTALKEIKWANIPHTFLVGNHEAETNDLRYASTQVMPKSFWIVDKPMFIPLQDVDLYLLPYNSQPLQSDLDIARGERKIIILSHNDIAGIRYGSIVSKVGYHIDDIEKACDLFVNGHLHNGEKITDKIINLGNLSGQNFGEDAFKYNHNVMILDTTTLQYELVENPYAFHFYKIDFTQGLYKYILKPNAIVSATIEESQYEVAKRLLEGTTYKITVHKTEAEAQEEFQHIDHLQKFKDCVLNKIGATDLIIEELNIICG